MTDGVTKQYETNSTLEAVYDIITSNISDPLAGSEARASVSHWVFRSFPDPVQMGKTAPEGWRFPIVVVNYPAVSMEPKSCDGSKHMIESQVIIGCYGEDRDHGNVKNSYEAARLADQVKHILTTTGKSELKIAALQIGSISESEPRTDFIGSREYKEKMITANFERFD